MTETTLAALRQLALFGALLTPLELLWPARADQRLLRRGLGLDLALALLNPLLVLWVGAALLAAASSGVADALGGLRPLLQAQPWSLQLVEVVLLSDLGMYLVHRLAHAVPALWRLHALHHEPAELDWVAAHRQHPVEVLLHLLVANLPLMALGFSTGPILGWILVQKLHTALVHANLRLPSGPWERWVAGPRFHRWHHAADPGAGNYASLLPVWDLLFGTYRLPAGEPAALGLYSSSNAAISRVSSLSL